MYEGSDVSIGLFQVIPIILLRKLSIMIKPKFVINEASVHFLKLKDVMVLDKAE